MKINFGFYVEPGVFTRKTIKIAPGEMHVVAGECPSRARESSVFLVVEPCKIIFLVENTIPQKEDRILLYSGYHSIPK